jgi:hypothetical protein
MSNKFDRCKIKLLFLFPWIYLFCSLHAVTLFFSVCWMKSFNLSLDLICGLSCVLLFLCGIKLSFVILSLLLLHTRKCISSKGTKLCWKILYPVSTYLNKGDGIFSSLLWIIFAVLWFAVKMSGILLSDFKAWVVE